MPTLNNTIEILNSKSTKILFGDLYGQEEEVIVKQILRYTSLVKEYDKKFKTNDIYIFSSPGRSEISGNHTDHNLGKVIAASINLDCIGVTEVTDNNKISIKSLTYNEDFVIDLDDLESAEKDTEAALLVKGVLEGVKKYGYKIGGFNVCITSDVICAAGVSSSASFEMLLCSIINYFYNNNEMDIITCGKVGKYAENTRWNKQSGLLDQLACAHGGLITIDFKDPEFPIIKDIDYTTIEQIYDLVIVSTGANHADLSEEYSSIPIEMKAVASNLGASVLRGVTLEDLLNNLDNLREVAGDRAILRSLHFFEENKRVDKQMDALNMGNYSDFIKLVNESGNSSWKWLQNCYSISATHEQAVTLYLALSELFIKKNGAGACRVHGGGFAGVILVLLPKEITKEYITYMRKYNNNGIYKVNIRKYGAVNINSLLA
ncbi:MAG TPA: galactokinase family protein [Clostridium sp.]|uniref:galactokinase n=1 Tax=Clostridium sp. TaxID=1506 RepID=UPI002F9545F6